MSGEIELLPPRDLTHIVGHAAGGYAGKSALPGKLVNVCVGGFVNNTTLSGSGSKTRFKGRRRFQFGIVPPAEARFALLNWHIRLGAAPCETDGGAITITKAYAACYDAAGNLVGGGTTVLYRGARSFTIPAGETEFLTDPLYPADFGLAAYPAGGFIDYRHLFDSAVGVTCPAPDQTFQPNGSQSYRAAPANVTDDVDATGVMAVPAGADVVNIFLPSYVLGRFAASLPSIVTIGDSIAARQNDMIGLGLGGAGLGGGGGYMKRAAAAAGIPHMTIAMGGRAASHINASIKTKAILNRFTVAHVALGTNDLNFSRPDFPAGTPVTVASQMDQFATLWAACRAAGIDTVLHSTIPPRTIDNDHKCTDQAQMLPVATQALAAQGALRDGYGFGPGETRDQLNTALRALVPGANGGPDVVFDLASFCEDAATPSMWKLSAYASTLAAAVAIGDSVVSLAASPPVGTALVVEPGVPNVDSGSQGGPNVCSVSGAGPYAASLVVANPYYAASPNVGATLAKVHASGATVKGTIGSDGTHPSAEAHIAAATALKPIYRALTRGVRAVVG